MKRGTAQTLVILVLAGWIGLIPVVRRTVLRGVYLLAIGHLGEFHTYLLSLGAWAPVVSITLMISQAIAIPVPVTLVMVANGLVFGVWYGMVISFVGGFIGSMAAYYLGRRLGRTAVQQFISPSALDAADRLMATKGRWAIVLGRWVPGIPCDPLSYAAGIMEMPLVSFMWLTVVGLIPANLVTAYFGAEVTGDVPTRYWLAGIAFVAVLLAGWTLMYRSRDYSATHRR